MRQGQKPGSEAQDMFAVWAHKLGIGNLDKPFTSHHPPNRQATKKHGHAPAAQLHASNVFGSPATPYRFHLALLL